MPYAILRVAKIKSAASASAKTDHNYRKHELRNVDPNSPHPNREYVNEKETDYWTLATARIEEVVSRKVRDDQVRAMELVMTGSPEAFIRDANGRAVDYSKSKWAQDNLNFLQNRYGKENIVSFTLHQDEKTPHIHAVIVPITGDGRLSAKDLFNPRTLRELQTEYAQAMKAHGMERGIEHSQTKHQPQRRLYGQADQLHEAIPPAAPVQGIRLDPIPLLGRDEWRTEQEAKINAEIARQVKQAQDRADAAIRQAQMNTMAAEQVKTLRKELSTSEGLKQAHFSESAQIKEQLNYWAVGVVQRDPEIEQEIAIHAQQVRAAGESVLKTHVEQILRGKVVDEESFAEQLLDRGYYLDTSKDKLHVGDITTGALFEFEALRPNGQPIGPHLNTAIERTAQRTQQKGQNSNEMER